VGVEAIVVVGALVAASAAVLASTAEPAPNTNRRFKPFDFASEFSILVPRLTRYLCRQRKDLDRRVQSQHSCATLAAAGIGDASAMFGAQ
jgi:hypothetical protein